LKVRSVTEASRRLTGVSCPRTFFRKNHTILHLLSPPSHLLEIIILVGLEIVILCSLWIQYPEYSKSEG
jgi:hypothetical protein